MKCLFCHRPLDELFDVLELQQKHQLVSCSIWRCQDCPYGSNRFRADGTVIRFDLGEEE